MADLGAIGIRYADNTVRVIPLSEATATGTARVLKTPLARVIFDVADAKSISTYNAPYRAFVQDHNRIQRGRHALYLQDWKEVRGHVKNSSDVGISRRVVVINGYGNCVGVGQSSAVDGSFTIVCDNNGTDPVLCVALPDDGDNRNAVVKWKVSPVAPL